MKETLSFQVRKEHSGHLYKRYSAIEGQKSTYEGFSTHPHLDHTPRFLSSRWSSGIYQWFLKLWDLHLDDDKNFVNSHVLPGLRNAEQSFVGKKPKCTEASHCAKVTHAWIQDRSNEGKLQGLQAEGLKEEPFTLWTSQTYLTMDKASIPCGAKARDKGRLTVVLTVLFSIQTTVSLLLPTLHLYRKVFWQMAGKCFNVTKSGYQLNYYENTLTY